MSPRPQNLDAGLAADIAHDLFPETARDQGRDMGLDGTLTILEYSEVDDGAGSIESTWTPGATVRMRLDPIGSSSRGLGARADRLNEASSHIATLLNAPEVTPEDRVSINGVTWIITAKRERSDPLVQRVEVRKL